MNTIWIYVLVVVLGIAFGYALPVLPRIQKMMRIISRISLFAMVTVMGCKIGMDPTFVENLAMIGVQSIVLAFAGIVGSVFFILLLQKLLMKSGHLVVYDEEDAKRKPVHFFTISLIAFIVGGFILMKWLQCSGRNEIINFIQLNDATIITAGLGSMIFCSGFEIGQKKQIIHDLRKSSMGLIIVPLGIMIGSVSFTILVGWIFGMHYGESGAIGGAAGWYTLVGVAMSRISPQLGALAFLTNLFREIFGMLWVPFVAKKFGPFAAIGPVGCTSMDTTLSVIVSSTNSSMAVVAFFNGILLTVIVPAVISFFIGFL